MVESEKKHIVGDMIRLGFNYISQIVSASIFPPIEEGAQKVMRHIEENMIHIEKRILREISTRLIIGLGGIFLILALLFFLIEHLSWTRAAAFFFIGITIFVTGLLLKLSKTDR